MVWPVMSREKDITMRVQSLQAGRALERRHNNSDEFNRLDDNSSYQLNLFDDGKPDTLLAVLAVISYCKRLLTDTPLGRTCKPVVGQRHIDKLLRICIRDTRVCSITLLSILFYFYALFEFADCLFVSLCNIEQVTSYKQKHDQTSKSIKSITCLINLTRHIFSIQVYHL